MVPNGAGGRDTRRTILRHIAEEPRGTVLVLSEHRPLNIAHAEFLRSHGYSAITAITYSDAVRIVDNEGDQAEIDAIVVASTIPDWHRREGEERPEEIPANSSLWQLDNVKRIFDVVKRRQEKPSLLFIAQDLIETGWYQITAEGLEELGIVYQVYKVGDLITLINALGESTVNCLMV